ncbi:hypothetical protein [Hyunsoonleella pacifica]|uniref:hypothetical protein n=1 Tax=Hyunsoonleella pacifica TaxID=1080224 RepID=UPI0013EF2762|nr:hypothetical protein [Hyunsoonleella pacifica]
MFKDVILKSTNASYALGIAAASFFAFCSKKDIVKSPTTPKRGNVQNTTINN